MSLLINMLCFVSGVMATLGALTAWAWYLGMQERLRRTEATKKDMEDAIRQIEEQQRAAAEVLRNSITELVKQQQTRSQTPVPQVPIDLNVITSVKDRLRKAVEITSKQAKIDVRQGPEFVMQHNELELEKLTVLKTILADGFDPVITICYNTGNQEMPLSSYIQSISKGLA